ncbi:hypothetical protein Desde_0510 [Desulfitobacterium dehalogenans ATCC 51507]|uniref:Uncharacterized protein n=1 Tax=Desulfitobacterium dehalogenans (strain ATCC 51507 / DSM 9161 / JW/IU-DC1) TaxID=756499 RepID=I4A4T6_DESDJ|nr:hypothetical protein [Desulfitobacterium dehalogenans]AFL98970.1 hypothetical protein Desde_0510 [Desulfitobacterium dehalogenans ATCC 51507]
MKAYKEYMNNIEVSETLHQRLISCAGKAQPQHRPPRIRRYATALACLALAMVSVFTLPRLMEHPIAPGPNNPGVSQSGDILSKYPLMFNQSRDHLAASNIAIPGHFWQELTAGELDAVFPGLTNTRTISATANFSSDGHEATLFNIDARVTSPSGLETTIQLAPGNVQLDYVFDVEAKTSDILGTEVTAGYFETRPNSRGQRNIIYFASFKLSDLAYYVELGGPETEKESLKREISELIGLLIEGGKADLTVLHPVLPELREERLTLEEARADADFGVYLPAALPEGFAFEDALRHINQIEDALFVNWTKGMGYIDWRVSLLEDKDKGRITLIAHRQNYDLSLYPIPRADSVPKELREIVDNPIFLRNELTLDTVRARAYEVADAGDEPGQRMGFSVLYGDVLVEIGVKGASPEVVFGILQGIGK